MRNKRPQILISNDDGVEAKGINELIDYLRSLGDLLVMAPDSARSGMSCALTAGTPVKYSLVRKEEGLTIYKCTGTPADCIKLALFAFPEFCPDVVIGGINHGDNSTINVHYSGTMGVVKEGCMKGIPSIGYSLCDHAYDADFSSTAPLIREITARVIASGLPEGTCLNVNFPLRKDYCGVKICRQAIGRWDNEWEKRKHPHHGDYFWLTGEFENGEPEQTDTDQWALANGYVAITPTKIDVTDYDLMDKLKAELNDLN
ncbi:MAG: 5'/3'-nucleotidase SurE [Bacteroides sp.]